MTDDEELANKINEYLKNIVDNVGKYFVSEINKVIPQVIDAIDNHPKRPHELLSNWEFHLILSITATLMKNYWVRIDSSLIKPDLEKFVYAFVDKLSNEFLNHCKKPEENNYE